MKYWYVLVILLTNISYAENRILEPIRDNVEGTVLNDIDCQLNLNHIYRSDDKVTWAHEATHGVNARIRNLFRQDNGYYLLKGDCFVIESPNITLNDVAKSIPEANRGIVYDLYLVKAVSDWNKTPLYVLDELIAYINGCLAGLEYNMKDRTVFSYNRVVELWHYCLAAQKLSRQSGFARQKELDNFMQFVYKHRILLIKEQIELKGWMK